LQKNTVAMETGFYDYDGSNKNETDEYFKKMQDLKEKRFEEK